MSSSKIEQKFESMKDYKDILKDVKKLLDKKKISYSASQSEIVIENGDKKEIEKIIASLPISSSVLSILLEVVKAKQNVYIRQKISF